jgi:hypothetical protein
MPGTVTVACKIPNGLILQIYKMEDHNEAVMGGGWRKVSQAVKVGDPVKVNGPAKYVGKDALHEIRYGVGLTHGIDADFFEKWIKDNADSEVVKLKLIFASPKAGEVIAQAKDQISLKSGMEGLDRNNLPEEFRQKITTATGA